MKKLKGYKKTEIGKIPEDWEVKTIGDTFNFLKTFSNSRGDLSNEKGDVYYIHYGDIHVKYNHFIDVNTAKLPSIHINKLKNPIEFIKNGDLIVADVSEDYAGMGKCIEIKNLKNEKVVAGLHTFLLRDKNNNFANGYKSYILLNETVSKDVKKIATGIFVLGISKTNFKNLKIPLPPLPEQQKIAKILTTWDNAIESQEKLISKKIEYKKGLSNKLLNGELRFSEFKEDWETKKLGDLIEKWSDGGTPSRNNSKYFNGYINWIVIDDIKRYIYNTKEKLTEEGLKKCSSELWNKETIILSTGATNR
ncbi:MAG: restriction endonuclease subunit S [Methanosarcinaceae archaeon]|nr:restriction endonuclease subunit S [Methanosarcinaceae archaeon]